MNEKNSSSEDINEKVYSYKKKFKRIKSLSFLKKNESEKAK